MCVCLSYQALDVASQGRTCLVVAHRLSTVQNADRVAVVAEGRVAESGSHAELLLKGGYSYTLKPDSQLSSRRNWPMANAELSNVEIACNRAQTE